MRFVGLDRPTDGGTPVFDEKHYVPQAWQMLRNGGVEDNPGYELVVHPPLGKQLIAIGEWLLGYNGWGWRAAAALAGTITVLLVIRVARRLTRSTLLGAAAGVLLICDGLSHVQSRMGMLDAFAAVFVLAAFATLLCDRDDVRARMAVVLAEGRIDDSPYGPRLGVRWWRFATGVLLGLGCAVKWSGVYWLAAFAVLTAGLRPDGTARRRRAAALGRDDRPRPRARRVGAGPAPGAGLPRGRGGRGSAARRASTATSSAWTAARTASARTVRGRSSPTRCGRCGSSAGTSSTSTPGSRRSPAASTRGSPSRGRGRWACGRCSITTRPATRSRAAATGDCVSAVMLIGTPALWWPAIPVLAWGLWRAVTRFDWRYGAVLVGYGAGILPWLANIDRQMYFFYMAPVAPFLVLATALVMGEILGRGDGPWERRQTGLLAVGLWVGLVVANFAYLWPILVGRPDHPGRVGRAALAAVVAPLSCCRSGAGGSAAEASSALAVSASPTPVSCSPVSRSLSTTRASSTTTTG